LLHDNLIITLKEKMALKKKTAVRTSSALLQIFVSSEMLSLDPTQQVFPPPHFSLRILFL
jgi:hypothetical protein